MNPVLRSLVLIALCAPVTFTAQAQGLVIDDFNTAQSGTGLVDGPGILGGERYVAAVAPNVLVIGGGTVNMSLGEGETAPPIVLYYEGNDDTTSIGFNLGGVDLTSGGSNDRFYLSVGEVTGTVESTIRIANSAPQFSTRDFAISEAGVYQLTFESFVAGPTPTDPASVDQVLIRFTLTSGDSIVVNQFISGPHPLLFEDGFETLVEGD